MKSFLGRRLGRAGAIPPMMNAVALGQAAWFKSSASGLDGCVACSWTPTGIQLKDTKNANSPILHFSDREWQAFTQGVRQGEFDRPVP